MTGHKKLIVRPPGSDYTATEFFHHSSAQRIATDTVIIQALKTQYPQLQLTIAPQLSCNLLAFAGAGHAHAVAIQDPTDPFPTNITWRMYLPPARRMDNQPGVLADKLVFGKFHYKWKSQEFVLYIVDGRDGDNAYPPVVNNYILSGEQRAADELIMAAGQWSMQLHNEVWVFDQGFWQKSAELWHSVENADWKDVILDPEMKEAIIEDVQGFFESREAYKKLKVPWKRGIIYYGPPGNGKTISIKAMMHSLYCLKNPIPTLYVRSLASYGGPEYSIKMIFAKARQEAPCYLVFEDLDTIVTESVRSYFLNEVDGLKNNDGILMVGSTNHLDRLDPGISKRPSRFDRKYLFPDPNFDQRVAYCKYWQSKLSDNPEIEFPDKLCDAVAKITDNFSFAYMQEAFVASLLALARRREKNGGDSVRTAGAIGGWIGVDNGMDGDDDEEDPELKKLALWKEMKKQVKALREGISEEAGV